MSGKTVLVTGANAGLGYEISLALAQQGARVVMGCRDAARASQARDRIIAASGNRSIRALALDLSEPASIRAFSEAFHAEVGQLDVLVHNAGVFGVPFSRNSRGWELHLATNYLGPFALTSLLLPLLEVRAGSRIVSVGSLANRNAKLPSELDFRYDKYDPFSAYARSKLALLSFTLELDRRLSRSGSGVIALSAHPGFATTDIAKNHRAGGQAGPIETWLRNRVRTLLATPQQAAQVIVHAASAATVRGGDYYGPAGLLELKGAPAPARVNRRARNSELARRLWSSSEALVGLRMLSDL